MNKTDLIEKVAKKTGMTKKDSAMVVDAIFSTAPKEGIIATELAANRRVQITGFGTFQTRKRKKRKGRNPQTGEAIKIKASKTVGFKVGKTLKTSI